MLCNQLKEDFNIVGLDSGLFEDDTLTDNFYKPDQQIVKDIRDISLDDLNNVENVVHLAALSNDPLGELDQNLTHEINYLATKKLIDLAIKQKVKRFIYISSQSMYGISDDKIELDEDLSEKKPVTEYAKTKWATEKYLFTQKDKNMIKVALRPSTVFGVSPRLRCDIVFNNLLACAFTSGKIEIKSDGTPWRPVIHIKDVCSAIKACLIAPEKLVDGKAFNLGIKNGNYQVKDIAKAAEDKMPKCKVIYTGEHLVDPRSYKVSFERILNDLKDFYKPEWNLKKGADELVNFFNEINFNEIDFRGKKTNRILSLKNKINTCLNTDLRFK